VLETEKRKDPKDLARCSQISAQPGTPDSVRCPRLDSGELAALGKVWRLTTIIHRTMRWCTGLFGEPTTASTTVGRAIHGRRVARANDRQGAPDCPVCNIQCLVHHYHESATVVYARIERRSRTGQEQWMSGGAPDCPVRHPIEGKDNLPCWPPTTPSFLGAIKGTPRHLEESPKDSLSILRLPHSISAHLIDRVSDLSSVLVVNSLCFILSSSLGLCAADLCVLLPTLLLCFYCDLCCKGERLQLVEIPHKREKKKSKKSRGI
jgi:hypothetical protein